MNKHGFIHRVGSIVAFLAVGLWVAGVYLPQTSAQEPPPGRPDPPPNIPSKPPGRTQPPGFSGSGGRPNHNAEDYTFTSCSTVRGVVINWGYRNEPKIPVTLTGPSWQTQKVTDDNGYYASDCLGMGVALVNPVSPPWLHPMTSDIAIRLGYRPNFEINLGLYGGNPAPSLEVTPTLTVTPEFVSPGEILTYTIRVTNTLDSPSGGGQTMGEVIVTDLLPQALTPVTVTSTTGVTEWWGNLLTVDLGSLSPGQGVAITFTAKVNNESSPAAVITHRASLLYTGHVAVQTSSVSVTSR